MVPKSIQKETNSPFATKTPTQLDTDWKNRLEKLFNNTKDQDDYFEIYSEPSNATISTIGIISDEYRDNDSCWSETDVTRRDDIVIQLSETAFYNTKVNPFPQLNFLPIRSASKRNLSGVIENDQNDDELTPREDLDNVSPENCNDKESASVEITKEVDDGQKNDEVPTADVGESNDIVEDRNKGNLATADGSVTVVEDVQNNETSPAAGTDTNEFKDDHINEHGFTDKDYHNNDDVLITYSGAGNDLEEYRKEENEVLPPADIDANEFKSDQNNSELPELSAKEINEDLSTVNNRTYGTDEVTDNCCDSELSPAAVAPGDLEDGANLASEDDGKKEVKDCHSNDDVPITDNGVTNDPKVLRAAEEIKPDEVNEDLAIDYNVTVEVPDNPAIQNNAELPENVTAEGNNDETNEDLTTAEGFKSEAEDNHSNKVSTAEIDKNEAKDEQNNDELVCKDDLSNVVKDNVCSSPADNQNEIIPMKYASVHEEHVPEVTQNEESSTLNRKMSRHSRSLPDTNSEKEQRFTNRKEDIMKRATSESKPPISSSLDESYACEQRKKRYKTKNRSKGNTVDTTRWTNVKNQLSKSTACTNVTSTTTVHVTTNDDAIFEALADMPDFINSSVIDLASSYVDDRVKRHKNQRTRFIDFESDIPTTPTSLTSSVRNDGLTTLFDDHISASEAYRQLNTLLKDGTSENLKAIMYDDYNDIRLDDDIASSEDEFLSDVDDLNLTKPNWTPPESELHRQVGIILRKLHPLESDYSQIVDDMLCKYLNYIHGKQRTAKLNRIVECVDKPISQQEKTELLIQREIDDKKLNRSFYYSPMEPRDFTELGERRREAIIKKYTRCHNDRQFCHNYFKRSIDNRPISKRASRVEKLKRELGLIFA